MNRKQVSPKKWKPLKRGIALIPKRMPLILPNPVNNRRIPHSKYFFDMLSSIYPGVIGQFILPYLWPLDTKDGMAWFTMIHEYGKECGLFQKNVFESIFLPAFEHAPDTWRNITINMSEYLKWTCCINDDMGSLYNMVGSIHSIDKIGLCMDFIQCRECMIPCKWCQKHAASDEENGLNPGCITRLSNTTSLDCAGRANIYFKVGIQCRIPMKKLVLKGLDTGTPIGAKIMNSVLNSLICMGGPKVLVLEDICTKKDGYGLIIATIAKALKDGCDTVSLDNWTIVGGILEGGSYFGGYIPVPIIEAISHHGYENIKSFSINNAALTVKKVDMTKSVRAILKMKKLEKLTINCKNSTNGFDSTGIFLKCMAREMMNHQESFPVLKDLTLSFGDSSFKRSSVTIAIAAVNGNHVDMDYYYDSDDMGNDDMGDGEAKFELAFMLGYNQCPALENLVLQCSRYVNSMSTHMNPFYSML